MNELSTDQAVACGMVHQRHGTPETLDELLTALGEMAATFDHIRGAMLGSRSPAATGRAEGINAVLLLVNALVINTNRRQGELMAEHAAYAAADEFQPFPDGN